MFLPFFEDTDAARAGEEPKLKHRIAAIEFLPTAVIAPRQNGQ